MLRKGFLLVLSILFVYQFTNAQLITQDYLVDSSNTFIQSRAENVNEEGWVDFKSDEAPRTYSLFDSLKQHAGLGTNDEMKLEREWSDDTLEYTHKQYDQYYKNVKVEYAEMTEHLINCFVQRLHGDIVENFDRSVSPSVSESAALQDAMNYLGYNDYAWQDNAMEDSLKTQTGDTSATYYPDGELLLANVNNGELVPSNYELSWRFKIKALDTTTVDTSIYDHIVYISADTGGVVKEMDPHKFGTGETTLYGDQEIDTKKRFWGWWYILKTNDHGRDIITKKGSFDQVHWWKSHVTDTNDDWDASKDKPVTAHYVVQEAWDLFDNKFDWHGMDNDGRRVRVWSSFKLGGPQYLEQHNRNLDYSLITFRSWEAENDATYTATLDYGGHEYTHGVIDFSSNMVLSRETGAVAESFCDIFGYMVEREHYLNNPGNSNWLIGEDSSPPNNVLRYMKDPNAYNDPDSYQGQYWVNPDANNCSDPDNQNDYCGIHRNAGVQNKWFYNLANDIGTEKAASIAFRSMTTYMDSKSDYHDAREGAIRAAIDLFGKCSNEHKKTVNNWHWVNVGKHWNQLNVNCTNITGYTFVCGDIMDQFEPLTYTATGEPGATFNWSNIPNAWTTNIQGPNNQFLEIEDFGTQNWPTTETISVSSSLGGSASFTIDFIDCDFRPCLDDGPFKVEKSSDKDLNLRVYPNPTNGRINIKLDRSIKNGRLSILTLSGKEIFNQSVHNTSNLSFQLDALSGIYLLRFVNKGNSYTEKIIITEK